MKHLSFLIKPASSMCNMQCQYCFYDDISEARACACHGIMNHQTMEALIDRSFERIDDTGTISYAFQGGEPTLAGVDYFTSFVSYVNSKKTQQTIQYSLQSNGLQWGDEWILFCQQNDVLVGISLDGPAFLHDTQRKDAVGGSTHARVMKSIVALKEAQVRFNVLCVVTKDSSAKAHEIYSFFCENNIDYVQFIPCLDVQNKGLAQRLERHHYQRFYIEYFSYWYEGVRNGYYQSVSLFEDVMSLLQDCAPTQCGGLGFCSPQFVIESDGAVYPCDFYALDEYKCGNVQTNTMKELMYHNVLTQFLQEKKESFAICDGCPYVSICRGGCKKINRTFLEDEYCGFQVFLQNCVPYL